MYIILPPDNLAISEFINPNDLNVLILHKNTITEQEITSIIEHCIFFFIQHTCTEYLLTPGTILESRHTEAWFLNFSAGNK